jgi:hypothetical protein
MFENFYIDLWRISLKKSISFKTNPPRICIEDFLEYKTNISLFLLKKLIKVLKRHGWWKFLKGYIV